MKILLHTCCAPCLIYPYEILTGRGYEVTAFFYNPNVHPFREYRERYFALAEYCEERHIPLRVGAYEMERFLAEVSSSASDLSRDSRSRTPGSLENRPAPARCDVCYRLRLSRTAAEARTLGFGEFTTTLLVSPYQDLRRIALAGDAAALEHGVLFLSEDMTAGYRESSQTSREIGLYRQSYCGCVYSEKERYQKSDPPRR